MRTIWESRTLAAPGEPASTARRHIVRARHGHAFTVQKGERFRIVDLYGEQIVDFAAWVQDTNLTVKLSMAYTRYHLSGATPAVGEYLWTNKDEPLFKITEDTVKVHDMTFVSHVSLMSFDVAELREMCCFPELYSKKGLHGHRSCASNVAEVMEPYGMKSYLEVTDPFNIFQNTPNYTLKRLGSSRPGDYIEFEALANAVCAVSCCPYDLDGVNGGHITDIAVVTGLAGSSTLHAGSN